MLESIFMRNSDSTNHNLETSHVILNVKITQIIEIRIHQSNESIFMRNSNSTNQSIEIGHVILQLNHQRNQTQNEQLIIINQSYVKLDVKTIKIIKIRIHQSNESILMGNSNSTNQSLEIGHVILRMKSISK